MMRKVKHGKGKSGSLWLAVGVTLLAAPLAAQAGGETSAELAGFLDARGYTAVRLDHLPTGHFAIGGVTGEERLELIVDTGASHTVIDQRSAERFGLLSEDRGGRATGVGSGSQTVESGRLSAVVIGGVDLGDLRVSVMDLSSVNDVLQRMGSGRIDGIVGADVLMAKRAIIDYGSLTLYFLD